MAEKPKVVIQQEKLENIKPYWNNPRVNDQAVEGLKESITQYGFLVPIVVDKEGTIITGHTRYKASVELGLEDVPVIYATHLDDKQTKAFRLADNRLSENAKWDEIRLAEELRTLNEMGFDAFTGFSKDELDCLCGMITASCLDDMDYATICGAVNAKATSVRNDVIFSCGNYRFYLSMDSYKVWEQAMLLKFPKRVDFINELIRRLGFTPADQNIKKSDQKKLDLKGEVH